MFVESFLSSFFFWVCCCCYTPWRGSTRRMCHHQFLISFFRFYCESSFFLFTFLRSDQFAHWIIDLIGQRIPPSLLTNRLPNAVNDVVYCPPGLQQREKMPSERGHVITGKPSQRRNRFFFERPNRTNKNVYITPLSYVYIWVIWSFPFFFTWSNLKVSNYLTPTKNSSSFVCWTLEKQTRWNLIQRLRRFFRETLRILLLHNVTTSLQWSEPIEGAL